MCAAYAGNFASAASAYAGKLSMLDQRRHQRVPALGHRGDHVVVEPGAVLDAVDAGRHELGDGLLAEARGR